MTNQNPTSTPAPKPGTKASGFRTSSPRPVSKTTAPVRTSASGPRTSKPEKPVTASGPSAAALRSAPPMKKRGKGNGFLSLVFVVGFCALGYMVWSSLLQFQSYGVIEGRVISVSAPWDGSIHNWQVRDGEEVTQGQVLAVIKNIDMDHELEKFGDELKMNQALLDAEISKIQFESQQRKEQSQKTIAEYHSANGELLSEREKYKELQRKFGRARRLLKTDNISRSKYEEVFFSLTGQKKKVKQLTESVEVLKYRSEQANEATDNGSPRLAPILATIDLSKSKIARLREKIDKGKIVSPVNGRVSKRHRLIGESTKSNEVVVEILEENSIQAVLYVPQRVVEEYEVGKEIEIALEPYAQQIHCTVDRFGNRFESAPTSIKRFYHANQALLPVYLTPSHETQTLLAARVGGTVKRPYEYSKGLEKIFSDSMETVNGWLPEQNQPATTVGSSDAIAPPENQSTEPVARPVGAVQIQTTGSPEVNVIDDFSL